MDTKANNNDMEKETLGLVLEEFTQEQKTTNQTISDLITAVNGLGGKFDDFKKDLDKPKTIAVNTDTKPIQSIIQKNLIDIKLMIGTHPKSIVRKFQLLLFPEQDAKLFYKVVFSRWFLWLTIMLAITNLYKWGIDYNSSQLAIKLEQLENDRIRKAWKYMYYENGKQTKRKMDEAYIKNRQE